MKKTLLVLSLLFLASCTMAQPQPQQPKIPMVKYPETQTGTPAEKYCTTQGGTISHESTLSGTMDRVYCTTKDGKKVDAWQYFSDGTITAPVGTGNTQTGTGVGAVKTGAVTPKYESEQMAD